MEETEGEKLVQGGTEAVVKLRGEDSNVSDMYSN